MKPILKPLFKYPGGKSSELKHLKSFFPSEFEIYIEPFVGGGAVFWAIEAKKWIINDCAEELVSIYLYSKKKDEIFLSYLFDISNIWKKKNHYINDVEKLIKRNYDNVKIYINITHGLLNELNQLPKEYEQFTDILMEIVSRKRKKLIEISKDKEIENWSENALGILGATIYTYIRELYNKVLFENSPQLKSALYLFLREYSYSSMFRFNSDGEFNVPFGGNTYSKKDFSLRVEQICCPDVVDKLNKTDIHLGDFSDALVDDESAFIFLDPPYDSEFSTYNGNIFNNKEQIRLRDSLRKIKKSKWLLVIKSTEFIEELYNQEGWYKSYFDKSYSVNFKNRNNKDVQHLVVTNYKLEDK